MNKRRREKAALNEERTEAEATARQINAQPWEPLPGMVKRQCGWCRYWFAVPANEANATSYCPDCASLGTRPERANGH